MEIQLKLLAPVALGVALAVAGTSSFAKGHDQGVADGGSGKITNTGDFSSGGIVAGVYVDGIGVFNGGELCDQLDGVCGVASYRDLDLGLTYGGDIVSLSPEDQRVKPVVGGGGRR